VRRCQDLDAVAGDDNETGLGARAIPAEGAKNAQATVFFEVGVAQLNGLAAQPVDLLSGWISHALLQPLQRLFPLVTLHHPPILCIARATRLLRTRLTVLPRRSIDHHR
jgi:hypothetical protein